VFSIQVRRARSTAERCWNAAQDVLVLGALALIVLKLTGVIAWSWWWVLSPMWISGIVLALGAGALLIGLRWHARRHARLWADQLGEPRTPGDSSPS
jgi:Flp pilus assembly protein TadB